MARHICNLVVQSITPSIEVADQLSLKEDSLGVATMGRFLGD